MINKNNIFIACDFANAQLLDNFLIPFIEKPLLKIGLELFAKEGLSLIKRLAKHYTIFLDLKLHDITNTVVKTIETLQDSKISFLTIHLSCGLKTIQQAKITADKLNIKLFGVTTLTNLDDEDCDQLFNTTINEQTIKLANIAAQCNLFGVVCSVHEVKKIKATYSNLKVVCPGISINAPLNDQKRIANLDDIKNNDVDYVVIGREIITDRQPYQRFQDIKQSLNLITSKVKI